MCDYHGAGRADRHWFVGTKLETGSIWCIETFYQTLSEKHGRNTALVNRSLNKGISLIKAFSWRCADRQITGLKKKMLGRKIWGVSGKDEQLPDSMCSKLNGKSLPGGKEGPNSSKFKIDVFHAARKTSKFQRLFWQRWVVTAVSRDGNRFLQNPDVCWVRRMGRGSKVQLWAGFRPIARETSLDQ